MRPAQQPRIGKLSERELDEIAQESYRQITQQHEHCTLTPKIMQICPSTDSEMVAKCGYSLSEFGTLYCTRPTPSAPETSCQEIAMRMYSLMLEVKRDNTDEFMEYYEMRMHEFESALGIKHEANP